MEVAVHDVARAEHGGVSCGGNLERPVEDREHSRVVGRRPKLLAFQRSGDERLAPAAVGHRRCRALVRTPELDQLACRRRGESLGYGPRDEVLHGVDVCADDAHVQVRRPLRPAGRGLPVKPFRRRVGRSRQPPRRSRRSRIACVHEKTLLPVRTDAIARFAPLPSSQGCARVDCRPVVAVGGWFHWPRITAGDPEGDAGA
jgi:hypothetical protein